jgi:hypothetical protein
VLPVLLSGAAIPAYQVYIVLRQRESRGKELYYKDD